MSAQAVRTWLRSLTRRLNSITAQASRAATRMAGSRMDVVTRAVPFAKMPTILHRGRPVSGRGLLTLWERLQPRAFHLPAGVREEPIGRGSCRERVCQYV